MAGKGSIRRSKQDRHCDACEAKIQVGRFYLALYDDVNGGPHDDWWYLCLICMDRLGVDATAVQEA